MLASFLIQPRICFLGKDLHLSTLLPQRVPHIANCHIEMHLDNHRLVFASWRGIETHCFYCHKPEHTKATCPILKSRKLKTCYGCQSPPHLFKDCPEQKNNCVGSKRPRMDPVSHRGANSAKAGHSSETQQSKLITSTVDNTTPPEIKEIPDNTAFSEKPQDHVEDHHSQAKI